MSNEAKEIAFWIGFWPAVTIVTWIGILIYRGINCSCG